MQRTPNGAAKTAYFHCRNRDASTLSLFSLSLAPLARVDELVFRFDPYPLHPPLLLNRLQQAARTAMKWACFDGQSERFAAHG